MFYALKFTAKNFSRFNSNPVKLFYSSRQFEFVDNFLTFLAINHLVPSCFIAILKTKHWKYPSKLQNEMIDFTRSFDTICPSDLFLVLTISCFDFSCHFLSNFSYIHSTIIEIFNVPTDIYLLTYNLWVHAENYQIIVNNFDFFRFLWNSKLYCYCFATLIDGIRYCSEPSEGMRTRLSNHPY